MGATDYAGLDYGLGSTNVDTTTGIRYGIIPLRKLHEWAIDEFEAQYGEPHCPNCGEELTEDEECCAYTCPNCGEENDEEFCYPETPLSWTYEGEGYALEMDESGDIWVFASPFKTRAQFCSPCAPGAGHLSHPCETGPETYCLGPEWFEDEKAPYPIATVKE